MYFEYKVLLILQNFMVIDNSKNQD